MEVFRIVQKKHSGTLTASGKPARWNSDGVHILYASSSRSLSCLENLIRRGSIGPGSIFECMIIFIPDKLINKINLSAIPKGWDGRDAASYGICRKIGDAWTAGNKSLALQVPSAIIKDEFNYLINVNHPDKDKIKLIGTEPFQFDPALIK